MGYLFYKSYSSIALDEAVQIKNTNDLKQSILNNSSKIEKITLLLNQNNTQLSEIISSLNSSNENKDTNILLKNIQRDFKNIREDLQNLKNKFEKNEVAEVNKFYLNNNNLNQLNTVKIIKYKFEQGLDFSKELDLFSDILEPKNENIIEKLYMINNQQFVGSEVLISNFKKESNAYISKYFIRPNNILKVILEYIKIEPSKKEKLTDNRLIALDNIYKQIIDGNYAKSLDLIISIDDENNSFFVKTTEQLSIAINFNRAFGDNF